MEKWEKNLYILVIKQNNLTCTQNMTGTRERVRSRGKNKKNIKKFTVLVAVAVDKSLPLLCDF